MAAYPVCVALCVPLNGWALQMLPGQECPSPWKESYAMSSHLCAVSKSEGDPPEWACLPRV